MTHLPQQTGYFQMKAKSPPAASPLPRNKADSGSWLHLELKAWLTPGSSRARPPAAPLWGRPCLWGSSRSPHGSLSQAGHSFGWSHPEAEKEPHVWLLLLWHPYLRCSLTMANWGSALPIPRPQNGTRPWPVAVKMGYLYINDSRKHRTHWRQQFLWGNILVFIFKWVTICWTIQHSSKFQRMQSVDSPDPLTRSLAVSLATGARSASFSGALPDQFRAPETRTGFSWFLHKWLYYSHSSGPWFFSIYTVFATSPGVRILFG